MSSANPTPAVRSIGLRTLLALSICAPDAASAESVFQVPRITDPIEIDGRLDEPVWQAALAIPLRFETRPAENQPPPVETECRIAYSDRHLFVSFRAWDADPSAIRAHLSDRDRAFQDDLVGIVLDTFNDGRRAFEFFVNPLGVQMDLFQDDVSGTETDAWDAIWDSAGRIDEGGYTVEMAIPFQQLRFPATQTEQTWGFDALRFYPRQQRHRISVHPLERGANCTLCQSSKMRGFAGVTPGRNLEIAPTLTGSRADERDDPPAGPLVEGDEDTELGVTARWGITPNLTLNGSINPDFSQVEADVAQIDINQRFALFFPERRPFFLEGADFFDTEIGAVFTRNIADPDWGLKITGKQGAHGLGAFFARDAKTNLLFPGSESSDSESFDFESDAGVARYRLDIGESSNIGALVTARSGDEYSNFVGGVDGLLRRAEHSFRYQLLFSETEYLEEIALDFGQPVGRLTDSAYRLGYNYDSKSWLAWARYRDFGGDFRADLGFVPRVGTTFVVGGAQRTWWGEAEDWYTRIEVGGDWDRREDEAGNVLEEEAELYFEVKGPLQSEIGVGAGVRDRFSEGTVFEDQTFVNTWFDIRPTGDLTFGFSAAAAEGVDFANNQAAEQLRISPFVRYDFGLHLRTNLSHDHRELDVEGGRLFTADLTRLRMVYQFNVRTFVRVLVERTAIDRDPSLYIDEVEAETERFFTQLLFSYKLNPQSVLFVGYSDNRLAEEDFDPVSTSRAYFVKLGYAWNR